MTRALIVEDDPRIMETVVDVVESLGHEHVTASCQDEARSRLNGQPYSYALIDLEIPVRQGRNFPRIENGFNFLRELVNQYGKQTPVIVMTAHGNEGPHQGVDCMKMGAADYIPKPFPVRGRTLDRAILEALENSGQAGTKKKASKRPSGSPRDFEGGKLILFKRRIEICGVDVPISPLMHKILKLLAEKRANGKFVASSGADLTELLGSDCGQNGIASAVLDFRNKLVQRLQEEANITCGRTDVLNSGGSGYRLQESITVQVGARTAATVAAGAASGSEVVSASPENLEGVIDLGHVALGIPLAEFVRSSDWSDRLPLWRLVIGTSCRCPCRKGGLRFVLHLLPQFVLVQPDRIGVLSDKLGNGQVFDQTRAAHSLLPTAHEDVATCEAIPRNVRLAVLFCVQRDKNSDRIEACTRLCEQAVAALIAFDETTKDDDWRVRQLDRGEILASLVKAMLAIDAGGPLRQLIDHTLASTEKYELTDAHLSAIFTLELRLKKLSVANAAISHWLEACEDELTSRTAHSPQPPADFRRDHKLSCNCGDCRALSEFLANPDEEQLRLPLAKARRQHLHQVIDGHRCDLTHVSERRGRPYTLVCTKTAASYETACKVHDCDPKQLNRTRRLLVTAGNQT